MHWRGKRIPNPLLVVLALLLAIAFWLRWRYLQEISLHVDEFTTLWAATRVQELGIPRMPSGVLYTRGLLASYVEAAFLGLLGFSYVAGRLPSLLFGLGSLVAVFFAGRREWNTRVGLLAAAGLAVLAEAVIWGGRARFYGQLQFFVLLTVWAAFAAVAREGRSGLRRLPLWLFVLSFTLALYSQEETLLLYPSLLLAMLIWAGREALRRPVFWAAQGVCLAALGSRYLLEIWGQPGYFETIQANRPYVGLILDLRGAWATYGPLLAAPDRLGWSLALLLAVGVAGIALIRSGWRLDTLSRYHQATLFFALQLAAVLVILFALVGTSWREARYLYLVQPFWLLAGAAGAVWLLERLIPGACLRWAATALLICLVLLSMYPAALGTLDRQVEGYDRALAYLAQVRREGEVVLSPQPPACALLLGTCDYYAVERGYEEFVIGRDGELVDRWTGAPLLQDAGHLAAVIQGAPRTWFVTDSFRLATRYGADYLRTVVEQFDIDLAEQGVLVLRADGWRDLPALGAQQVISPALEMGPMALSAWARGELQPGADLPVMLFWQGREPIQEQLNTSLQLVARSGERVAQADGPPARGMIPTTLLFESGLPDAKNLPVPSNLAPGRYRLEVTAYDVATVTPLAPPAPVGWFLLGPPVSPPEQMLETAWQDGLRLVGGDGIPVSIPPGEELGLRLVWAADGPVSRDYTAFVQLVGPDGAPVAQHDKAPEEGFYPTSAWNRGEWVEDTYTLAVPDSLAAGDYRLIVGWYRPDTGERLPLDGGEDVLVLGEYGVGP